MKLTRRTFLQFLGLSAASVIPGIQALTSKTIKPTGERIDRHAEHFRKLQGEWERAMAGKITVRGESECGVIHWGIDPANAGKLRLCEDAPSGWELSRDPVTRLFRPHRTYELPVAITREPGRKGDLVSVYML